MQRKIELDLLASAIQSASQTAESRGDHAAQMALLECRVDVEREWRALERGRLAEEAKEGGA